MWSNEYDVLRMRTVPKSSTTPYLNDMENSNVFQRLYGHRAKPRAYAQPGKFSFLSIEYHLLIASSIFVFCLRVSNTVLKSSLECEIDENCTFKPQIEKGSPFMSPRSEREAVKRESSRSKRSAPVSPDSAGMPSEEGIMVDELGAAVKVNYQSITSFIP